MKGKEADGSTEEEYTVTSHSEGSDQETQATHRGPAKITKNRMDAVTHGERPMEREQAKAAHSEKVELTQNGCVLEQEITREYDHNQNLDAGTHTFPPSPHPAWHFLTVWP